MGWIGQPMESMPAPLARIRATISRETVAEMRLTDVDPWVASPAALVDEFLSELLREPPLPQEPVVDAGDWDVTLSLSVDGGLSRSWRRQGDPQSAGGETDGRTPSDVLLTHLGDPGSRQRIADASGVGEQDVSTRRQPVVPDDPQGIALDRELWHISPSGVRHPRGLVTLGRALPDRWLYSPLTIVDAAGETGWTGAIGTGTGLDGLADYGVTPTVFLEGQPAELVRTAGSDWVWAVDPTGPSPRVLLGQPFGRGGGVSSLLLWSDGRFGMPTRVGPELVELALAHRHALTDAGFVATIAQVDDPAAAQVLLATGGFFPLEDAVAAWGLDG